MLSRKQILVAGIATAVFLVLLPTLVAADRGCPNGTECVEHCRAGGSTGKCERRWYRWRYQWRCKCNPCQGTLVLGACVSSIGVGVSCDGNGQNCRPTASG